MGWRRWKDINPHPKESRREKVMPHRVSCLVKVYDVQRNTTQSGSFLVIVHVNAGFKN